MNNLKDKIKLVIIKENGEVDYIINNDSDNNVISQNNYVNCMDIYKELAKQNLEGIDDKRFSRHLFYLKDYLKTNFVEEFKNINYNPQNCYEDLILYYQLTRFGNIVLINGTIHNILVIPRQGINEIEKDKLTQMMDVFHGDEIWSLADDMHIKIGERDGEKYGYLDIGETSQGTIDEIVNQYLEKTKNKRIIN